MEGGGRARVAVFALLLMAGCGAATPTTGETPGVPGGAATQPWSAPRQSGVLSPAERDAALAAFGPQRLRVLSHGAEPRAGMAYALRPSDEQVNEASVAMRVTAPDGEMIETDQKLLLLVRSTTVDATAARFTSQLLWSGGEVPGGHGTTVEFSISPDGRAQAAPVAPGSEACREASVEVATTTLDSIVQLPTDPIGIGARWQVIREKSTAIATVVVVTTYELTAVTGRDLDLRFEVDGYFVEGSSSETDAPPSEFVTKVSGTARASLGHPMATRMDQKGSSRIVMSPEGIEQTVEMAVSGGSRTLPALPQGVVVPTVAACVVGAARDAECAQLIADVNAGQSGLAGDPGDPPDFEKHAKQLDAVAAALDETQLTDPTLIGYRDGYRSVIVDMAQVMRDMPKKDPTVTARAEAAAQREHDVLGRLNAYCGRR